MRLIPMLAAMFATSMPFATFAAESTPEYPLHTVERVTTSVSVSIAGTVAANKSVQLTAQMPGRIAEIAGEEGDVFSQNTTLVSLDDAALRAKLDAANANREAAGAAIRNAQAQYQRELNSPRSNSAGTAPGGMGFPAMMDYMFTNPMQDSMGMRDRTSERQSDIVAAETRVAQANTNFRAAEAQIKELQAVLRDTRSIAPFNGVIEKVHVEVGDTVQPGQPILNFSETNNYKIEADLPIRLSKTLRVGQKLPVKLDGSGPAIMSPVSRIHPVADHKHHTVRVELTLPTGTSATTGQYAEININDQNSQDSQLAVPNSAIVRKGGLPLVFAVAEDGTARLRVIRIGKSSGNDKQVVLSGINQGDRIVLAPPPGFRAGTQVAEAANTEAAPAAE